MALLLRGPGGEEEPLRDGLVVGRKVVGLTDIKISRNHLLVEAAATGAGFTVRRKKSNPTRLRRAGAAAGDDVEVGEHEPVLLRAGDRLWIQNRTAPFEPLEEAVNWAARKGDTARVLEVVEAPRQVLAPDTPPQAAAAQAAAAAAATGLRGASAAAAAAAAAAADHVRKEQADAASSGGSRRRSRSPGRAAAGEPLAKRRAATATTGDEPLFDFASDNASAGGAGDSTRTPPRLRHGGDDQGGEADELVSSGRDQAVLVMVGIPGVGKTTLLEKLMGSCGSVTWTRCSQDDEGTREKCIKKAHKALQDGGSVAIDRTDFDADQRKHWVDLAHEFNAYPLVL